MEKTDSYRGGNLSDAFFEKFEKSKFYNELYKKHHDELIIGVRDGYINIYYNCDNIAKIDGSDFDKAELSSYYLSVEKKEGNQRDDKYVKVDCQTLLDNYDLIKANSDNRRKFEKQAQSRLFIDNNTNADSGWFCIDVEYTKSFADKPKMEDWRFDIIAISKTAPFRVALIELKYGRGAIGGKSGITKHIKDFFYFHKNNLFEGLKSELQSIVQSLIKLGVEVPESLHNIEMQDFEKTPEYYFITLDNNKESERGSLPMDTMAGYLFKKEDEIGWTTSRYSKNSIDILGDDSVWSKTFNPVFLFSEAQLPVLGINDIINDPKYIIKTINVK